MTAPTDEVAVLKDIIRRLVNAGDWMADSITIGNQEEAEHFASEWYSFKNPIIHTILREKITK